jgi:hypothetical protein
MNQLSQSAFITAICRRPREGGFYAAAEPASGFARSAGNRVRRKQTLAACCADSARDGEDGIEAFLANGKTRNPDQRCAADAAIRRKQNSEETFCDLASPTSFDPTSVNWDAACLDWTASGSNRRACHSSFGLASPNSVLTTAEDGLRVARRDVAWAGDLAIACWNRV